MELREIIERIDEVKVSLDNAFDNGSLDIDRIVNELESLKPALTAIGERLINNEMVRTPLKAKLKNGEDQVTQIDIFAGDFR